MSVRSVYTYADVTSNTTIKREIGVGVQFIENPTAPFTDQNGKLNCFQCAMFTKLKLGRFD